MVSIIWLAARISAASRSTKPRGRRAFSFCGFLFFSLMMTTGILVSERCRCLRGSRIWRQGRRRAARRADAGKWVCLVVSLHAEPEVGPMNKRVTLEMPEEMHQLIVEYASEAGAEPDDYLRQMIQRELENLQDLAAADEAMKRIQSGEDKVVSSEEFWRGLDD
ncbi:type II toxin-antitoxin system RelB family antitoxin [Rhizobium glycinendophyticum]